MLCITHFPQYTHPTRCQKRFYNLCWKAVRVSAIKFKRNSMNLREFEAAFVPDSLQQDRCSIISQCWVHLKDSITYRPHLYLVHEVRIYLQNAASGHRRPLSYDGFARLAQKIGKFTCRPPDLCPTIHFLRPTRFAILSSRLLI